MTGVQDRHRIPMDPGDVFEASASSRHRQVLFSVSHTESTIATSDLAVEIAALEHSVDPNVVSRTQRTRVYIALARVHRETLGDLGSVTCDDPSWLVESTEATWPLARHIRRIRTAWYKTAEGTV